MDKSLVKHSHIKLNMDIETRDKILFGRYKKNTYKFDNARTFQLLDREKLELLLGDNFIDPDSSYCGSPIAFKIYEFMDKYPKYIAHGYATVNNEDDYGMYITGVEKGEPAEDTDELADYMELFGDSAVFDSLTMFCNYE